MLCVGICCNCYRKDAVEVKDNSSYRGTYVWHKKLFILSKIIVVTWDETTVKNQDQPANDVKVMHHLPRAGDLFIKHLIDFPTVKINFSSYKRWGMIKFLII